MSLEESYDVLRDQRPHVLRHRLTELLNRDAIHVPAVAEHLLPILIILPDGLAILVMLPIELLPERTLGRMVPPNDDSVLAVVVLAENDPAHSFTPSLVLALLVLIPGRVRIVVRRAHRPRSGWAVGRVVEMRGFLVTARHRTFLARQLLLARLLPLVVVATLGSRRSSVSLALEL
jgi:hypothetical protein